MNSWNIVHCSLLHWSIELPHLLWHSEVKQCHWWPSGWSRRLSDMKCTVMIWSSRVRTLAGSNLRCLVLIISRTWTKNKFNKYCKICLTLRGYKVSMLTHPYPHRFCRRFGGHHQSPDWLPLGFLFDWVIYKFWDLWNDPECPTSRQRVVKHDFAGED